MTEEQPFHWVFHCPQHEQAEDFLALVRKIAPEYGAELSTRSEQGGRLLRAVFPEKDSNASEERGREFWLELHSRCLDLNLAMELVEGEEDATGWQALPEDLEDEGEGTASQGLSRAGGGSNESPAIPRADIPTETIYEVLRADDPDMERNLEETTQWIESRGLPVINLLSYLDLPLYQKYAKSHPDEREQNLFLHMLHTWTCYRRYGGMCVQAPAPLLEIFTDPRYLRLNTTMFRTPRPALCLQLPQWTLTLHEAEGARVQWVKEIYLTHLEPPTPLDDRELTLMIVTHDDHGQFGFVPLEVPLSLPAVGQSIDAFFEPGFDDPETGANSRDLHKLTSVAATYCLYATARDPRRYLAAGETS